MIDEVSKLLNLMNRRWFNSTLSNATKSIPMFSFNFLSPGMFSCFSHWLSSFDSLAASKDESIIGGRAVKG